MALQWDPCHLQSQIPAAERCCWDIHGQQKYVTCFCLSIHYKALILTCHWQHGTQYSDSLIACFESRATGSMARSIQTVSLLALKVQFVSKCCLNLFLDCVTTEVTPNPLNNISEQFMVNIGCKRQLSASVTVINIQQIRCTVHEMFRYFTWQYKFPIWIVSVSCSLCSKCRPREQVRAGSSAPLSQWCILVEVAVFCHSALH